MQENLTRREGGGGRKGEGSERSFFGASHVILCFAVAATPQVGWIEAGKARRLLRYKYYNTHTATKERGKEKKATNACSI